MKLYLIQHGKALPKHLDPNRPLNDEGRNETRKIAEFMKPLNITVDYLWHSRKDRAIQTAQILTTAVTIEKDTIARDDLNPTDDVTPIATELTAAENSIMIVGHLPFLSKLAAVLLTGNESSQPIRFKNSAINALTSEQSNQWQINWILTPDLIPSRPSPK